MTENTGQDITKARAWIQAQEAAKTEQFLAEVNAAMLKYGRQLVAEPYLQNGLILARLRVDIRED